MKVRNAVRGFTLIEVLIVVAIIAILASIALPAYREYVMQGRIPEATNALSDMRVRAEQYFQDTYPHSYVGFPCAATGLQNFTVACSGLTATTYTITATGTGPMAGFAYSIDQSNAKSTDSVASGWTLPSPNDCWARTKNGSC